MPTTPNPHLNPRLENTGNHHDHPATSTTTIAAKNTVRCLELLFKLHSHARHKTVVVSATCCCSSAADRAVRCVSRHQSTPCATSHYMHFTTLLSHHLSQALLSPTHQNASVITSNAPFSALGLNNVGALTAFIGSASPISWR